MSMQQAAYAILTVVKRDSRRPAVLTLVQLELTTDRLYLWGNCQSTL